MPASLSYMRKKFWKVMVASVWTLARHGDALFGLNGLVQALVVAAAHHQTAGELVHNDHLAVVHHIVHIPLHDAARLDGLVDMVLQRHVFGVGQVFHIKIRLGLFHARRGKGGRLFLLVHHVVAVHLLVVVFLVVQLGHHHGASVCAQSYRLSCTGRWICRPRPEMISGVRASSMRMESTSSTMA